jgi:hypothetical protein
MEDSPMGCKLLLIAQFQEADLETSARRRLDACREAVQPSSNFDITLFCPTEAELEAMGYVPKDRAAKPQLSQEIADALNQVLDAVWDDEIERYEEDERPEDHSFEALVILENWLRGTNKTAAQLADRAAAEKAGW